MEYRDLPIGRKLALLILFGKRLVRGAGVSWVRDL